MPNSPVNNDLVDSDGTLTPFAAHMIALGRLCVTWSYMERLLNETLPPLLGCSDAQAAVIATEMSGTSTICNMLKTLAYADAPSPEWRDSFEKVLNQISGELAPIRNRYVHDYWTLSEGSIERLDQRAKLQKPQAFKDKGLHFNSWHTAKPGEIDDLSAKAAIFIMILYAARSDLIKWRQLGKTPERLLLLGVENMLDRQAQPRTAKPRS